jgi:hypothetical protein
LSCSFEQNLKTNIPIRNRNLNLKWSLYLNLRLTLTKTEPELVIESALRTFRGKKCLGSLEMPPCIFVLSTHLHPASCYFLHTFILQAFPLYRCSYCKFLLSTYFHPANYYFLHMFTSQDPALFNNSHCSLFCHP